MKKFLSHAGRKPWEGFKQESDIIKPESQSNRSSEAMKRGGLDTLFW